MPASDCSDMLKAPADRTRRRIVRALLAGPLSVNEIVKAVDASQYNVSKHLGILRRAGIVEVEQDGTRRLYDIVETLRRRLSNKQNVINLGCCEFRFDRLRRCPQCRAPRTLMKPSSTDTRVIRLVRGILVTRRTSRPRCRLAAGDLAENLGKTKRPTPGGPGRWAWIGRERAGRAQAGLFSLWGVGLRAAGLWAFAVAVGTVATGFELFER